VSLLTFGSFRCFGFLCGCGCGRTPGISLFGLFRLRPSLTFAFTPSPRLPCVDSSSRSLSTLSSLLPCFYSPSRLSFFVSRLGFCLFVFPSFSSPSPRLPRVDSSFHCIRLFRLLRLFRFFRLHSRPRLGYPVSILRFVTSSLSSLSRFRTRTLLSRLCRCRFFSVVRPRPFVVLDSCCCLLTSHCCLFRCGSLFTCRCCCLLHLIVRLCHVSVLCFRCFVVSFVVSCLSSLLFGRWVWICLTVGLWSWILCYWIAL
jgi:hypothetical protein